MSEEEKVNLIADSIAEQAKQRFLEYFDDQSYDISTWSPIERLMGFALLHALEHHDMFGGYGGRREFIFGPDVAAFNPDTFAWGNQDGLIVVPQMCVGRYRADFGVFTRDYRGKGLRGIIECDGHDFHEKSKQQATRDKARDRYFQSEGYIVLRYTGSEIYRDPLQAAFAALSIFYQRSSTLGKER